MRSTMSYDGLQDLSVYYSRQIIRQPSKPDDMKGIAACTNVNQGEQIARDLNELFEMN
jgi:hypothetical protein